jgi:Protein of unknown function (DUF3306)
MSNDRDNEPFLSRWSRQKQQQVQKAKTPPVAAKSDEAEPELDLSKLTKVEDLTAESDITQFLQKGVPAEAGAAEDVEPRPGDPRFRRGGGEPVGLQRTRRHPRVV